MTGHWHGSPPTRDEVLAEIARELSMRRGEYPDRVAANTLTQKQSDERIDRLQAAYDVLGELWPRNQREFPL